MATDFAQTDTAMGCTPAAFCSGATLGPTCLGRKAIEGGTLGSSQFIVQLGTPNGTVKWATLEWEITPGAAFTSWAAGNYTIPINVTQAGGANTTIQEAYVCRVDSGCTSLSVIGSAVGLFVDISATGVQFIDVSGAAVASPSSTDKILIVVIMQDEVDSNVQVGITPNQNITTPLVAATSGVPIYRRRRAA